MVTPLRALAPPWSLALVTVLAAGCVGSARPPGSRVANALPENDPISRGTVQGQAFPLGEAEQMVVRLGRDADGRVVVLQVLSPVLTPEQQEEVRRAFAIGGFKRQNALPPQTDPWVETLTPNKK